MKSNPMDITKIMHIRQALQNLQLKLDNLQSDFANISVSEAKKQKNLPPYLRAESSDIPPSKIAKEVWSTILSFVVYTVSDDYSVLKSYTSAISHDSVLKFLDKMVEEMQHKDNYSLKDICLIGYYLHATKELVSAELEYIDGELL